MSEFNFFGGPEELAEQMKRHMDHQHMHHQDSIHAVKQFLDELNENQLEVLDLILTQSIQTEGMAGQHVRGQIRQILQIKYDICACGESHNPDEILREDRGPTIPNQDTTHKGKPIQDVELSDDLTDESLTQEEYLEVCEKFNVRPKANGTPKVICNGCETEYVSLEDRMRRKPGIDGCSACQQKSAWG